MSFPTWSDLNEKPLISPVGQRNIRDLENDSGSVAVMISTLPDIRYVESNSGRKKSLPFSPGSLFIAEDAKVAFAGPYLGAPCGAMVLESLIARGASKIVAVGWCGSISDKLVTGDILIPESAISDEGTSRNYMEMPKDTYFPLTFSDAKLNRALKEAVEAEDTGIVCRTGRLWTTDAIYRETATKIECFRGMGAIAVEMECSALFAVAAFRKVELSAILIVSDDLSTEKWKPGFKQAAFKEGRKKLLNAVMKASRTL